MSKLDDQSVWRNTDDRAGYDRRHSQWRYLKALHGNSDLSRLDFERITCDRDVQVKRFIAVGESPICKQQWNVSLISYRWELGTAHTQYIC